MRKPRLALIAGAAAALALSAAGGAAAAQTGRQAPVVGQVYLNGNTAGDNTIAGFDRHADGTLTPIPGSPFAAGGAGTGQATASQGRSS